KHLSRIEKIDLLVVDGPPYYVQPAARYPVLPLLRSKLTSDSILILDDGLRLGERRAVSYWQRDFGVVVEFFTHDRGTFFIQIPLS
ncbi:MAG: class I SAM-dependent methyltransferase, partial [Planctomycetaceae bacterium]|nr:class I SAM-dependent methyltransferase [Planctomycetaceae bacterium]